MTASAENLSLPFTSSDLSADWLTDALRSTGTLKSAAVTSYTQKTIGEGVGLLGELVQVTPTYDSAEAGAPKTFIAKFAAPAEANRDLANMFGFYENETKFYGGLAAELPVYIPACYYMDMDGESGRFVLLIEDLSHMRLGDQVAGCTAEEAGALMKAIGKVHAQTWNDNLPPGTDFLRKVDGDHFTLVIPDFFQQSWPGLEENFSKLIPDELSGLGDQYPAASPSMLKRLAAGPTCLVHGDYRLDNMFFGETPDDIAIIDWQISGLARGPYDLGYLLSQSVNVADRRSAEKGIVEAYHQTLVDGGVTGYTVEDVWADYKLSVMHCAVYPTAAGGAGMDLGNERGVALVEAMATRSFTAIVDLNAMEMLEG